MTLARRVDVAALRDAPQQVAPHRQPALVAHRLEQPEFGAVDAGLPDRRDAAGGEPRQDQREVVAALPGGGLPGQVERPRDQRVGVNLPGLRGAARQ